LSPQKDWEVNNPSTLSKTLAKLQTIQKEFNNNQSNGKKVSLADIIVLGGCAAIESSAKKAGFDVEVPFMPGRMDASQNQTDVDSFSVLEPKADGFRNYCFKGCEEFSVEFLIDKAQLLTLSAPEMTVILGGMRSLNANYDQSSHGILTQKPEVLSNDFFVNILDMGIEWKKSSSVKGIFEGTDRKSGNKKWTGTYVDLIFSSNSQLRALAEVYASSDGLHKFIYDFISAWVKVMNLDRFDI
jgi:catalase-peroxidase